MQQGKSLQLQKEEPVHIPEAQQGKYYSRIQHTQSLNIVLFEQIYNWVPDMYNTSTNLPDNMPDDLKEHIRGEEARGNKNVSGSMLL